MFQNPKGQEVGWIDGNCYKTTRSMSKDQIYRFKHHFGGKYLKLPIGIQKTILDRLKTLKIVYVDVLIIGIEERSYWTRTKVEDIYKEGVLIKEDMGNSNITKWGFQVIWSVHGKRLDYKQKQLVP